MIIAGLHTPSPSNSAPESLQLRAALLTQYVQIQRWPEEFSSLIYFLNVSKISLFTCKLKWATTAF